MLYIYSLEGERERENSIRNIDTVGIGVRREILGYKGRLALQLAPPNFQRQAPGQRGIERSNFQS